MRFLLAILLLFGSCSNIAVERSLEEGMLSIQAYNAREAKIAKVQAEYNRTLRALAHLYSVINLTKDTYGAKVQLHQRAIDLVTELSQLYADQAEALAVIGEALEANPPEPDERDRL